MVSFILLFIIPNIFYLLFPIGKFSIFHHLHHYKYVCPCFSRGWLCVFSTTPLKQKISTTTTKSILKLNTDFIWWPNICLKSVLYHAHTHSHINITPLTNCILAFGCACLCPYVLRELQIFTPQFWQTKPYFDTELRWMSSSQHPILIHRAHTRTFSALLFGFFKYICWDILSLAND